jgi:hypothetical protein
MGRTLRNITKNLHVGEIGEGPVKNKSVQNYSVQYHGYNQSPNSQRFSNDGWAESLISRLPNNSADIFNIK